VRSSSEQKVGVAMMTKACSVLTACKGLISIWTLPPSTISSRSQIVLSRSDFIGVELPIIMVKLRDLFLSC